MDTIRRNFPTVTVALRAAVTLLLLAAASLVAAGARPAVAAAPPAAEALVEPSPGSYTGLGFDACTAPSTQTMNAWLASPYRAVGIYFGGVNRGCSQPNLTATWVATQQAAGWHLIPLYVGPQPTCTTTTKQVRFDLSNAATQGRSSAEDAVTQATALGLAKESVLIYDMEAYSTTDANCRSAVLAFMNAWTARLHDLGYLSGFYSSMNSGVADQVAAYNSANYARPDYLDFARWDTVVTVSDSAIPDSYWTPQRRMKQYRGGHDETWGGVTINIDNDYLEMAPMVKTPFGDYNANGWSDIMARRPSDGTLFIYPGNGSYLTPPSPVNYGWNGMNLITRFGDFDLDGFEDVLAREASTGYLWLYRGAGTGMNGRVYLGWGWGGLREITPIGDFDGDGYVDLVAINSSGALVLYQGHGTWLAGPTTIGTGWSGLDALTGVGDFNEDGVVDLVARGKSSGSLYLFPGQSGGFGASIWLNGGWGGMRDLVGVGDFNRDGHTDITAVETASGYMYLYPANGVTLIGKIYFGAGWGGFQPVL